VAHLLAAKAMSCVPCKAIRGQLQRGSQIDLASSSQAATHVLINLCKMPKSSSTKGSSKKAGDAFVAGTEYSTAVPLTLPSVSATSSKGTGGSDTAAGTRG
jgi:hypothetical protein